ncbi:MAG TPA: hypothetical protein VGO87_04340 [Acidimicrobiia bacterium]|jgi:hypothetical protein
MDLASFTEALRRLSAEDIRTCAAGLGAQEASVADEVVQWQAELTVCRLLHSRCTRAETQRANAAAHRTARLVVDTARRRGMELPDSDVTCVARAAAGVARGLSLPALPGQFLELILARWARAVETGARREISAA